MAMGFAAFAVPDAHIDLLVSRPGWVHDYLEGNRPDAGDATLPADWPAQAPQSLGGWGINHRNVDLYHWILNGGPALATGAGSLFQTWYEPDRHAALKLDRHNERFAFRSGQLPELLALSEAVTVDSTLAAFTDWCKERGERHDDLDHYACQPFVDEFAQFARGLRAAIERGDGIVW